MIADEDRMAEVPAGKLHTQSKAETCALQILVHIEIIGFFPVGLRFHRNATETHTSDSVLERPYLDRRFLKETHRGHWAHHLRIHTWEHKQIEIVRTLGETRLNGKYLKSLTDLFLRGTGVERWQQDFRIHSCRRRTCRAAGSSTRGDVPNRQGSFRLGPRK